MLDLFVKLKRKYCVLRNCLVETTENSWTSQGHFDLSRYKI